MGIDDSINLSEAPALLFAKVWSRIVSLKGGEEQALQALDHPDPAIFVLSRRQFLEANRNDSERRRAASAQEEAYALISELISNLRNLGAERRIIASGLYVGTGQRQLVPAELWPAANSMVRELAALWRASIVLVEDKFDPGAARRWL